MRLFCYRLLYLGAVFGIWVLNFYLAGFLPH